MSHPETPSAAPPTILDLPTGPATCYVEGAGAPAFLLVHGLPGSARDFRWLSPALAPHARVIRLDMPGFGGTPRATAPSGAVEARARFVLACVDALALERPILVGHSMGGVIATMAATLAPARVAGLALIASPGLRTHRALRRISKPVARRLVESPLLARIFRRPLGAAFAQMGFRHATPDEQLHTLRCIVETVIETHADRLRALQVPALHAFCEDDPLVDPEIMAETATVVGGAVHRYPTGGHNPQKHMANELAAALLEWGRAL